MYAGRTNSIVKTGGATPTQTKEVKATSFPTVVSPDSGYALSQATVTAPDNLTAENIKSGVSIAGVTGTYEGGGGSDPEAEFFKALVCTNLPSNPANAPAGLITSHPITNWPQRVYVGPDGLDLSNITTVPGMSTIDLTYLFQFYSGKSSDEAGGPIKFGNEKITMSHSYLMGLPEGGWELYVSSFSSCRFVNDIILQEANVPRGEILAASFSDIAKFSLGTININTSLTLTLPSNITAITGYATVSGISSAKLNLVMLATTPPTLETSNTVRNINSITVPAGTLEAYRTATNWSQFADIMVEATTVTTEGGA